MSTGAELTFDTRDIKKMIKMLNRAGLSPQKAVNRGTSKSAQVLKRATKAEAPVRAAKADAPVRPGTLKRNIVIKAERSQLKGKKVRQVTMKGGAEANAQLQKPIQHPGILGGKSKTAYYPASMEYGFLARAPGGGTQYIPGRYFMRSAADSVSEQVKSTTTETVMQELEKIWQEGQ